MCHFVESCHKNNFFFLRSSRTEMHISKYYIEMNNIEAYIISINFSSSDLSFWICVECKTQPKQEQDEILKRMQRRKRNIFFIYYNLRSSWAAQLEIYSELFHKKKKKSFAFIASVELVTLMWFSYILFKIS